MEIESTFLEQLIRSLKDSLSKMEEAFEKDDAEKFNQIKKFAIQTQRKIQEEIK